MTATFPPVDRDALVAAVERERARMGWPGGSVFDTADLAASDCERLAETAETLAALLRAPHGVPAQMLVDIGRTMAARAMRVAETGLLCGGRP